MGKNESKKLKEKETKLGKVQKKKSEINLRPPEVAKNGKYHILYVNDTENAKNLKQSRGIFEISKIPRSLQYMSQGTWISDSPKWHISKIPHSSYYVSPEVLLAYHSNSYFL